MPFTDLTTANTTYAPHHDPNVTGVASKGLGIITCIDTRIDPLAALGLKPGDAKIIRNAGARVTDDVLRSLVISVAALGVNRVALIQHTDCGVAKNTQESLTSLITEEIPDATVNMNFLTIADQAQTLREDADKIRNHPLLPTGLEVGEFIYDVHSGQLTQLA